MVAVGDEFSIYRTTLNFLIRLSLLIVSFAGYLMAQLLKQRKVNTILTSYKVYKLRTCVRKTKA